MKQELTASVVIPVRNCVSTIGLVVTALRDQTVAPTRYEIVVVDDGSTDGTEEWLRTNAGGNLVHIRTEPDGGPWRAGAVRNRGLQAATGDVVIFIDADILAGPGLVEAHLSAHQGEEGSLAVAGYIYGYPAETNLRAPEILKPPPLDDLVGRLPQFVAQVNPDWHDGRDGKLLREWPDMRDCPWPWFLFWTPNVSVRRAQALKIGGFDEGFKGWGFEDTEFAYRLDLSGVTFNYRREAWVVHYPHPIRSNFDGMRGNIDYLLAKHPVPQLEVLIWSYLAELEFDESLSVGKAVFAQLEREEVPGPDLANLVDVLMELDAQKSASVWSSGRIPGAAAEKLTWIRSDKRFEQSSLIGLCVPAPQGEFDTAVLVEDWAQLPDRVLDAVLIEMRRIASRVILVGAARGAAAMRLAQLKGVLPAITIGDTVGAALN